jgi:hypothetical protein
MIRGGMMRGMMMSMMIRGGGGCDMAMRYSCTWSLPANQHCSTRLTRNCPGLCLSRRPVVKRNFSSNSHVMNCPCLCALALFTLIFNVFQ